MGDSSRFPLRVVDAWDLDPAVREALQPNASVVADSGHLRRLPRYFYEIPSWAEAMRVQLSPNFALWEFIQTDVREAPPLRTFPRYVPCAITMVALSLERFREAVATFVHIAANGGYRSPRHAVNRTPTVHCWGTAVNVYRIGDHYMDDREPIERFGAIAQATLPGIWARPFGTGPGATTDHLHLDFGYVTSIPHDAPDDGSRWAAEERRASC